MLNFTLLATVGVAIVLLAIAAGLAARHRRARPAVIGVGLAAAVTGLYLTGLTQLIVDGVVATVAWFQITPWTDLTTWGVSLLGAGILLAVIGAFLPKRERAAVAPKAAPKPAAAAPATSQSAQVQAKPRPAAAPEKKQQGIDPEDAEIEELLRKRGIM